MKCNATTERVTLITNIYSDRENKAKYRVTFLEAVSGKRVTKYLCGTHLHSVKAYEKRLAKKADYDVKLEIEKL